MDISDNEIVYTYSGELNFDGRYKYQIVINMDTGEYEEILEEI